MKRIIIAISLLALNCGNIETAAEKFADKITSEIDQQSDDTVSDEDQNDTGEITTLEPNEGKRFFVGTFEKNSLYNSCDDFPEIMRIYSENGNIYLENNQHDLIAKGEIFEDNTFDFSVMNQDQYGNSSNVLSCTCSYYSDKYYSDNLDCGCDGKVDCEINYDKLE